MAHGGLEQVMATVSYVSSEPLVWQILGVVFGIAGLIGVLSFLGEIGEGFADSRRKRRIRRERVEKASQEGTEAAIREAETQKRESEAKREHLQSQLLEGIVGDSKAERVKFGLFAMFVVIAALVAVTR